MPSEAEVASAYTKIARHAGVSLERGDDGATGVESLRIAIGRSARRLFEATQGMNDATLSDAMRKSIWPLTIGLGAVAARGLNDCLARGELSGYRTLSEAELAEQARAFAEASGAHDTSTSGDVAFDLTGWLVLAKHHVATLLFPATGPDVIVREAFGTIRAAANIAAGCAHRESSAAAPA